MTKVRGYFITCSNHSNCYNMQPQWWHTSLTLSPSVPTKVPYANSFDPDETPSNSASHPDPGCLTLRKTVKTTLSDIETFWKLKQARNIAVDNLVGRLRVEHYVFVLSDSLVWQCYRRTFVPAKFWQQTSRMKSDFLAPLLEEEWRAEVARCNQKK